MILAHFGSGIFDLTLSYGLLNHLRVYSWPTQNTNPGEDIPEKGGAESHRDTPCHWQGGRGARTHPLLHQTGYQNHGLQEYHLTWRVTRTSNGVTI